MHITCSLNLWVLVPHCNAFKRWHLSVISLYGLARLVVLCVACKQEIEPDKSEEHRVYHKTGLVLSSRGVCKS